MPKHPDQRYLRHPPRLAWLREQNGRGYTAIGVLPASGVRPASGDVIRHGGCGGTSALALSKSGNDHTAMGMGGTGYGRDLCFGHWWHWDLVGGIGCGSANESHRSVRTLLRVVDLHPRAKGAFLPSSFGAKGGNPKPWPKLPVACRPWSCCCPELPLTSDPGHKPTTPGQPCRNVESWGGGGPRSPFSNPPPPTGGGSRGRLSFFHIFHAHFKSPQPPLPRKRPPCNNSKTPKASVFTEEH